MDHMIFEVGTALILVAIVVFVLDNGGGDPGVPGL